MKSFTKDIKVDEGQLNFYFSKVNTIEGEKYFIATYDRDINPYIFYMVQKQGIWRIDQSQHNIPTWITDLEINFINAIRENG